METVYVFTPPISGRRVVFGERRTRRAHEEGARREEASNVLQREEGERERE